MKYLFLHYILTLFTHTHSCGSIRPCQPSLVPVSFSKSASSSLLRHLLSRRSVAVVQVVPPVRHVSNVLNASVLEYYTQSHTLLFLCSHASPFYTLHLFELSRETH